MREKIHICEPRSQHLSILTHKKLTVELRGEELYAKYQKGWYKVEGNIYFQYIVIGKVEND